MQKEILLATTAACSLLFASHQAQAVTVANPICADNTALFDPDRAKTSWSCPATRSRSSRRA